MAEILVTGASGLIGSHILLELLQNGHSVRALTRDANAASIHISRLIVHYGFDSELCRKIEWVEGNLHNVAQYEEYLNDVETVFHCAGLVSTAARDRKKMYDVNVQCTADLVNHCLQTSVKWFGHMSSVSTLGPNPEGLVDEDYFWKQDKGMSYYALTKYQAEQEVWRAKEEGLSVCIFNPSVVIGPDGKNGNLHKLMEQLKKGLRFYLGGKSGFVDVRDLARFSVLQWINKSKGTRIIVSAENLSHHEFLKQCGTELGVAAPSYLVGKRLFHLASFFELLYRIRMPQERILHTDLFNMGSSVNRYNNHRSIEMGAVYQNIQASIQNTIRFYT